MPSRTRRVTGPPAITIEVLAAGYGDCLLVTCPVETRGGAPRDWRLLIDTGPDESYGALRQRLLAIATDEDGRRHIDLFVVTHIDHDHIGRVAQLLDDRELNLHFGDIWFNAPPRRRTRGVAEGQSLAEILGGREAGLPWNRAWDGGAALAGGVWRAGDADAPQLTLLSPTQVELDKLYRTWAKELLRLKAKEGELAEPEQARTRGAQPTLEALAARASATDAAVANGSSIAFLLEHRGASALLLADAFPGVLVQAIRALVELRNGSGQLVVDAVKLSHHGSRANVTTALMESIRGQHFIFSTDNSRFRHPNDEAVARVILQSKQPTLWFNYDTPHNRRWTGPEFTARYGHRAMYPEGTGAGVALRLSGRG